MSRESEFLLSWLCGAGTPPPPLVDWQALLVLADSHGVLPFFCREFRGALPEPLQARACDEWAASASLVCELEFLLEHFRLRGLDVLALKGPVLSQVLYGSPSLRRSDDLDLLVRAKDFRSAQVLITDLGFAPVCPADDYHQSFQRGNTWVELHFSVAPPSSPAMDLETAWARSSVVPFRSQRVRFFFRPDLLIYLIIHAVKHDFARLIWVLDFSYALADLDEPGADQVLTMAEALGLQGALLTTCELARLGFHSQLPAAIAEAIARKPVIAVQAAGIWTRLLGGPANPQTNHQGAGLFLHLEQSARSRWSQRLRYFRLSQQDLFWARQHHIHPRWMLILRPLRLVAKHGPGPVWRTLFPLHR